MAVGRRLLVVGDDDLLRSPFRHQRGNDTGDENHHDDAVKHVVADEVDTWRHLQPHTHHHHGDGTGCMCRCQAEHHVAVALRQTEQQARQVSGHCLAEGSEEGDEQYHPQHVRTVHQCPYVDEHAHTNQEVGNEEGVADELQTVHQWRHLGNIPI